MKRLTCNLLDRMRMRAFEFAGIVIEANMLTLYRSE